MLTTNCNACYGPKEDLRAVLCNTCKQISSEAEQHFAAENPGASEGSILYAGRMALNDRRHHAHRNYVDPRAHAAGRGTFPTRPQPTSEGAPDGQG